MKKLRLLLWERCNKSCPGCCNKQFNLNDLPIIQNKEFCSYDEIELTGGEPMLYPIKVLKQIEIIKKNGFTGKIYMYSAKVDTQQIINVLKIINGLTITLHDEYPRDIKKFLMFDKKLTSSGINLSKKSFRLNIFKKVTINLNNINSFWKIKSEIKWIKNCPLPIDEVFKKIDLDPLFC